MSEQFIPSPPPYQTIVVETDGQIEWLTLNRPEALNALNVRMMLELQHYFDDLRHRHEIRVVIVKGAGKSFCAGLDIKEEGPQIDMASVNGGMRVQRRASGVIRSMRLCPQPIIALVQGSACGGGFGMVLASDVRIGAPDARMNAAFIRIGLSGCDTGVSYLLPKLVGSSVASELMLTGRFLTAERAEALGLFSKLVPHEGLEEAGRALANEMLLTSPLGLRLTKEGINANLDAPSLDAAIAIEDRQQILCSQTQDFRESLTAFLEKRTPEYKDL